jgi:hypothetical protein
MPNLKTADWGWIYQRRFGLLLDMSAQFALPDGFKKRTHFVCFTYNQEFDAAIAQIPHGTGDIKPFGYLPDRIAKTNALDVAFVENLEGGDHVTAIMTRHFDGAIPERRFLVRV